MTNSWMTFNNLVCALDAVAAFVIVCLMLETTPNASFHGFLYGDAQGRWGMIRRLVYTAVAIALFAKSVFIYEGRIYVNPIDAVIWIMVLFALIFFPAVRAFGLVDQDHWIGFRRSRQH